LDELGLRTGGREPFPVLFELKSQSCADAVDPSAATRPALWTGHLHRSVKEMLDLHNRGWEGGAYLEDFSCRLEQVDYEEPVLISTDYRFLRRMRAHFTGEFSHLSHLTNGQILADLAKRHLTLAADLKTEVETWRERNLPGFTVGIHARHTNEKGGKNTDIRKLESALSRVLSRNPVDRIFLCTDNVATEESLQSRYGNIVVKDKRFPEANDVVHLTAHASGHGIRTAKEAVTEMYLLSQCDVLIDANNSNFGYASSLWSEGRSNPDLAAEPTGIKPLLRRFKQRFRPTPGVEPDIRL